MRSVTSWIHKILEKIRVKIKIKDLNDSTTKQHFKIKDLQGPREEMAKSNIQRIA